MRETDDFGARMKAYEAVETARQLDVRLPIYARIDGRAFSTFTRGMERPFDDRMTSAMVETTKYLVDKTHARIGYTQSDEISLIWLAEGERADIFFSGKIQKMVSVLASMAAAKFVTVCPEGYRERLAHFDTRVFQLPSKTEGANAFLWRAMDARKNAISMLAQSRFSTKQLFGKGQTDMLDMLSDLGIAFEDLPERFTRGSFVRRITESRNLTADELERIPAAHRPLGPVERSSVVVVSMPPFNCVRNREEVVFDGATPICARDLRAPE
jgi:tRNA(His) 5'-end guanylyltransferase